MATVDQNNLANREMELSTRPQIKQMATTVKSIHMGKPITAFLSKNQRKDALMKFLVALVILTLLFIPIDGFGAGVTARHTAINITTDSTLVSKGPRALLILQNDSNVDMYCNIAGAAAVLNQGIRLLANGGAFGFDVAVPLSAVYCIHGGTGNKVLLLTEG